MDKNQEIKMIKKEIEKDQLNDDFVLRTPANSPKTHAIIIEKNQYSPDELNIKAWDKIVWQNKDSYPHIITWDMGELEDAELNYKEKHQEVFERPGIYYYHCQYHDKERGIVIVS